MVLGSKEDIEQVIAYLGTKMKDKLSYDRSTYDIRRIFLSNPKLAGRTIASLNLPEKYNAIISRIRRGDNDMLAHGGTTLELGDRIRVIAKRDELNKLADYFGDSYQASSSINLFSFGFGLALGLWVGSLNIPLWDDITIRLGFAGGPLIVGLILGSLKRTGPILWTLPYSTSIVLQQLGMMFLLAYIGVNNGDLFFF
jgi:putative transport protein